MSCSSSKPSPFPPTNTQLQLESTLNIPPDPGSCLQSPLTNSITSANSHTILNSQNQNVNTILITFRHVLQYYWRGIYNIENQSNNHHNIASPTPPQIWLAQNVYPLVTPMRMICFIVSLISFILACGFFMETELYNKYVSSGGHHYALLLVFLVAVVHFLFLIFLMFFSFFTSAYEMYKNHFLLKSLGEFIVMRVMSLLISGMEHDHQEGSSEVAALLTCVFLTVDSLCIIVLLKPGHHYSLLDATLTLTLHLALEGEGIYAITADFFVFIILAFKNFLWHHIGHVHPSNNEQLQLVWFASDLVADNFSSV
ncbi:hypothetical protein VNO77_17091 [Canavalia gladiata]|uniref:Uncharacterized protein n=1 Tax=Canavalia gladiata TaxID=3824 RepID=A0AAN9LM43_CANGL